MELAGRATEIETIEGKIRVVFQCCNDEVFELWMSPALPHLTVGTIVRVWTVRLDVRLESGGYYEAIQNWEDLSL